MTRLCFVFLCCIVLLLGSTPTFSLAQTPEPTATPGIGAQPDRCEPNNSRETACALTMDQVNGPYTFIPAGEQDYYRAVIDPATNLATTITVRSTGSLDLLLTITHDDGSPITSISTPAISTTLQSDITGGIILHVENRSPADPSGSTYGIELRRTLPATPPPPDAAQELKPDALENNWTFSTASPIGIGIVYDLNFVCPVANGCAGGDHDYLRVPVKRGGKYIFATFDLGPGVDTVLDLYWGSETQPVASNDDAGPLGFASLLRWVAPNDGFAVIRVGPRNGGATVDVPDPKTSTYRFAAAILGTPLADDIVGRVQQQTQPPTPTPSPVAVSGASTGGTGSGAGTTSPPAAPRPTSTPLPTAPVTTTTVVQGGSTGNGPSISDASTGLAVVMVEKAELRVEPKPNSELLQELPNETIVTLTGKAVGAWVRVVTSDGVMPGWVKSQDLRRLPPTVPTPQVGVTMPLTGTATPAPASNAEQPTVSAAPSSFAVRALPPVVADDAPENPLRVARVITVTLIEATTLPVKTPRSSVQKATPLPTTPIAGQRVQLVNVFGDVLAEQISPASGVVEFQRDLLPSEGVRIRIPAIGVETPADTGEPLTIAIPKGATP